MAGQEKRQEDQEKKPKEDIVSIVKEFISYFEKMDRSDKDDNSIKHR